MDTITRREFLRGLGVTAGALALAACAPKEETVTAEKTSEEELEQEAEALIEEVTSPTTLRFCHWWPEGWHDTWLPIIEEKAPVRFEQEVTPYGNYRELILSQYAAGNAADIVQVDYVWPRIDYRKGLVLPFNSALELHGIKDELWSFDPYIANAFEGNIFAIELFTMEALMCWVNLDLVREAGYPEDDLPVWGHEDFDKWTWPDLVEFVKAVTIKNPDGTHKQYGWAHADTSWLFNFHSASYPTELTDDPEGWEDTRSLLDEPDNIQAARDITDLVLVHEAAPSLEAEAGVQGGLFRAGMAVVERTWGNTGLIDAELPFEMAPMHLPFKNKRVQRVTGNQLQVNAATKHPAEAFEASILMCCDYDVCLAMMNRRAELPAYDPARYLDQLPTGEYADLIKVNMARVELTGVCDYCAENIKFFGPGREGRISPFPFNTLDAEMQAAYVGEKSIEQAMEDAAAAINAEYERQPVDW